MLSCFPFFVCCVLSVFLCRVFFSFFFGVFFSNQEGTLAGASPREKNRGGSLWKKGNLLTKDIFFGFFFHLGAGDLAQGLMMRLFCF